MSVDSLWHPSLRLRILAPAALVAIPAIALLLYLGLDRRRQAERVVSQSAERLASLQAEHQHQLVESTRQLLIAVSQSRDVREGDGAACSAYLRQLLPQLGTTYANLGVLDPEGTLVCSGLTMVATDMSDRTYFQRALESRAFTVGEHIIGRQTAGAVLPFAYPVLNAQGGVRLIVFATVDLKRLNLDFDEDWPADATLIVTDRNDAIVAMHPDGAKWIGTSLKQDRITEQIGSALHGVLDFEERGETQIVAFRRVEPADTGLTVRVLLSKSGATAAATAPIDRSLVGVTLAALMVIVGVKVASDRLLLRPIAALTKASRRLAAGDLGARAASSTTIPELRELGKDFDDMAAAIEEREGARLLAERERKELEQQYHQAQKMEAVGRLAGGIAHDFNNMLTAILGYCELLLADPTVGESQRGDIREIDKAGKTAAQLTRQLLAFSRREIVEPVVLDVNAIVSSMDKMLHRLVGEHLQMEATLAPGLARVKVDRAQLEQVILNLTVNARDAMPSGGRLTIETANVHFPDGLGSAFLAAPAGSYVMIAVTDEGAGMPPDLFEHIFEPFFTTKGTGKGTGLGLSTVYGIIKQAGGGIDIDSEVGRGSVFRIYFPTSSEELRTDEPPKDPLTVDRGKATILVVEDDEGIRDLTSKVLRRQGYAVLVASGGDQARDICERHGGSIDLLLSDVVMPGMNGPAVAEMLLKIRPAIRVMFMSGYTDDTVVRHGVMERDVPFLQKPFTPERLANKIREVLG